MTMVQGGEGLSPVDLGVTLGPMLAV
jgi:hypothetical protein